VTFGFSVAIPNSTRRFLSGSSQEQSDPLSKLDQLIAALPASETEQPVFRSPGKPLNLRRPLFTNQIGCSYISSTRTGAPDSTRKERITTWSLIACFRNPYAKSEKRQRNGPSLLIASAEEWPRALQRRAGPEGPSLRLNAIHDRRPRETEQRLATHRRRAASPRFDAAQFSERPLAPANLKRSSRINDRLDRPSPCGPISHPLRNLHAGANSNSRNDL